MAILIKANGEQIEIKPQAGKKKITFDQIKEAIGGGYVEHVSIGKLTPKGKEKAIWIDEEGRLKGFQYNPVASEIVRSKVVGNIVGDMVITDEDEVE